MFNEEPPEKKKKKKCYLSSRNECKRFIENSSTRSFPVKNPIRIRVRNELWWALELRWEARTAGEGNALVIFNQLDPNTRTMSQVYFSFCLFSWLSSSRSMTNPISRFRSPSRPRSAAITLFFLDVFFFLFIYLFNPCLAA